MHVTSTLTTRVTLCLVAVALFVAGCARSRSSETGSNNSSNPPKLLIAGATGGSQNRVGTVSGYVLAGTLPDQPTHARIYLWPSTQPSQSDVEKLASALGLSGTPSRHMYGWDLTTPAGELRVRDDLGQRWLYRRADQTTCDQAYVNFNIDQPPANIPHGMCAGAPSAAPPVNGPDEAMTKAAAASLLSALGVTGDDEFSAGAPTSNLTISPKVGGLPTLGTDWHITSIDVDSRGVTAATGPLHAPTAGDDYPLQTAQAAFDSLAAPARPKVSLYCSPIDQPPVTCSTTEPIEITGAHLGLVSALNATSAHATILVPSWFFTLADGRVANTAIAVDPAYVGKPPPPTEVATGTVASGRPAAAPKPASS